MISKAKILRDLFKSKPILRIAGAHNALGAKLIEKNGFDGIWASGLEISTAYAVPDANILTMTEYLHAASVMNEATQLPVVCDCDTGYGNASNVRHMIKKYEAAGIAAVVIEDKIFPKVNSFVPGRQELASVEEFSGKIEAAKNAQINPDFMVFARIEALIAGWGMEEALRRAYAYAEAGADGLVIHSKASTPDEIYEFVQKLKISIPIVVIPTTFYAVKSKEFASHGIRMVIYANQGLRASMKAMDEVFGAIRDADSTETVEKNISTMKEVFEIQGMNVLKEEEKKYSKKETIQAVIPAAGDPRSQADLDGLLGEKPLCMIDIAGKTLLDRQLDTLRSCGVNDLYVVGGFRGDRIRADGVQILKNPDYKESGSVYSILSAASYFKTKVLMAFSDIIFDRQIVERLLLSPHPITLVIDRAYQSLPFRDKKRDLVVADDSSKDAKDRNLNVSSWKPLRRIGCGISEKEANYEFIGMAYFKDQGVTALKDAWARALKQDTGKKFYEAASPKQADFNDLIQFMIDSGEKIHGLEIEHGWSEIHSQKDYERVNAYFETRPKAASIK